MLKRVNEERRLTPVTMAEASFPSPYPSGLEYASPARGMWNIVHTGMLIPEAHEIFVCAASCLRGVVLTAAEMGLSHRFSTVEVREENLFDGTMEELVIEGVCAILEKLPKLPPAVLVYTSCVHHFSGCDIPMIYDELRRRYPQVDFVDCYMNPILRKSGMTPDQLMRSRLYQPLKERPRQEKAVAIIGNDLHTAEDSDLKLLLRQSGCHIHEITACKTYEEYQKMAEASIYISSYPSAKVGGDALAQRLGGRHLYIPFSFDYDEIEQGLKTVARTLGQPEQDHAHRRAQCDAALERTRNILGDTPIAIDYTFSPRPLGLAKLLLNAGFRVERVYLDAVTGEEKPAFDWLKIHHPNLLLYPTVHAAMRFHSPEQTSDFLAVGQKAAHFTNTSHFVNVIEGGGMHGFQAILGTLELMEQAYFEEKPLKALIQIKGMGCGGCV